MLKRMHARKKEPITLIMIMSLMAESETISRCVEAAEPLLFGLGAATDVVSAGLRELGQQVPDAEIPESLLRGLEQIKTLSRDLAPALLGIGAPLNNFFQTTEKLIAILEQRSFSAE